MKQEKEIHFIIGKEDIREITQIITSCGFKFDKKIIIEDEYSDDSNLNLLKSKKGYRQRTVNGKIEFTYKEMKNGKVYEDNMSEERYFKKIQDLKNKIKICKERTVFVKVNTEVVIDNMGEAGCMLEIECKKGNPETILKEINFPPKLIKRTNLGCNELAFDKII